MLTIPVTLTVGAMLYSVWALEFVLDTPIHPIHSFTSELAAFDQPTGWVFRLFDLLAGLAFAVAAAVGVRAADGLWVRLGWIGLGTFGIATAIDSQWALSCSPSIDSVCAAAESAGTVPLTHRLHTYSSATAGAAALFSAVAFTGAIRRDGHFGKISAGITVVLAVSTTAALVATLTETPVGVVQRIQLATTAAALLFLAGMVQRSRGISAYNPVPG